MADNLHKAKVNKNDEFYTQYEDIEKEMNAYVEYNKDVFKNKTILLPCDDHDWSNFTKYFIANFDAFKIKRLISTSYAKSSGSEKPSEFEKASVNFDASKDKEHGKIFILERDEKGNKKKFEFAGYLKGDGDFDSDEVKDLRDGSDIIITNPPFSLFRKFLAWIMEGEKEFIIIGNKMAVTNRDMFPLIKDGKIWLGVNSVKNFKKPDGSFQTFGNVGWFTNIDHNVRHEKMELSTSEDNIKFNKYLKKELKKYGIKNYPKYSNYNALEIKYVKSIPSDYKGIMGVPPTFMDKFNPEQFEIVGKTGDLDYIKNECDFFLMPTEEQIKFYKKQNKTWRLQNGYIVNKDNIAQTLSSRIFIKLKETK